MRKVYEDIWKDFKKYILFTKINKYYKELYGIDKLLKEDELHKKDELHKEDELLNDLINYCIEIVKLLNEYNDIQINYEIKGTFDEKIERIKQIINSIKKVNINLHMMLDQN